jgi:hypothetical protein
MMSLALCFRVFPEQVSSDHSVHGSCEFERVEKDTFFWKLPNVAKPLPCEIVLKKVLLLYFHVELLIPQYVICYLRLFSY